MPVDPKRVQAVFLMAVEHQDPPIARLSWTANARPIWSCGNGF